jgi:hypothetical protein
MSGRFPVVGVAACTLGSCPCALEREREEVGLARVFGTASALCGVEDAVGVDLPLEAV